MRHLRKIGLLLGMLCGHVAPCLASTTASPQTYATAAARILAPYDKAGILSGTFLVAENGHVIFEKAYGFANREWNVRNTPNTRFMIGSISKQFTATAILQLVEQGKIGLDDSISKYDPDAPENWTNITIRRLLDHTSGIPKFNDLPPKDLMWRVPETPQSMLNMMHNRPLAFEPGASYAYDNSGYIALGYVIEKASRLSYCDYLDRNIFIPAGMKDSGCGDLSRIIPRHADGYERHAGKIEKAILVAPSSFLAAGGLYSTVSDLLHWQKALAAGRLITAESRKAAQTDYGHGYGFGWSIQHIFGHEQIGHNGGMDGYSAMLASYPREGLVVIGLTNFTGGPAERIADDLTALYFHDSGKSEETLLNDATQFSNRMIHPAPAPGSEAALRKTINDFQTMPNPASSQKIVGELGALESITFKAVNFDGADIYDVRFEKGNLEWTIRMYDGHVDASGFHRLP